MATQDEEPEEELISICPNCGAGWGIEEISFQECDACGYPEMDEEELLESTIDNDDDWADEGWEDVDDEFTFSELCNLDE